MSAATINQDFRVISNAIDAISTLNGSITLDTQPSGVIDIKHAGTTVVSINVDGSIEMTAKPSQNINLTTSDGGKTVISDLDVSHEHEYTEEVTVSHDLKSASVTVVTPTSGSFQILVDGAVDEVVGTSSDCSVCAFMVKKQSVDEGLVNTLCSTVGDENESLNVTWVGSTVTIALTGDLTNYTATESKFKVKIIGA